MGLLKYPKVAGEDEDSFGEQLMKQLLTTALGTAVSSGIQGGLGGALGDYFAQKREGRAADRAASNRAEAAQANELAIREGNLQKMIEAMPDPTKQAQFRTARATGAFFPEAPTTDEPQTAMGPQLPFASLPREMEYQTRMFWQDNPELAEKYRTPKEERPWWARRGLQEDKLESTERVQTGKNETSKEVARIRARGQENAARTRASAASAKGGGGGVLPPSKDKKFQALKTIYQTAAAAARNPVSGIIDEERNPEVKAAKKEFYDYAVGIGASPQEIDAVLGGGAPAPQAVPAAGDAALRQEMSANAAKAGKVVPPEQWTPDQIKKYQAGRGK